MNKLIELFILPTLAGLIPFILGSRWSTKVKAIAALLTFLFALGACYGLSERRSWLLAGRIVDAGTLSGIAQAHITELGSLQDLQSEDNGNFQIEIAPGLFEPKRISIRVAKEGYRPADRSFEPPIDNVLIELEKSP